MKILARVFGIPAVTLILFTTGCWQKSLEPFYSERDLKNSPLLIGNWQEEKEDGKGSVWSFTANGERRYLLKITDSDETYEFDARLFTLDTKEFLDLYSRKRSLSEIPAHHLMRVAISDERLEARMLSLEWVKNWVSVHPKSISHISVSDPEDLDNSDKREIVLTASTGDLQKFVREHLDAEGFFDGAANLKRKK